LLFFLLFLSAERLILYLHSLLLTNPKEVSYSKNWVFPSDLLWFQRWLEILTLGPTFVEMITWNDYGESHYVGPLSSKHYDDGASKWANDM
jgi:hypothetical protein